MYNRNISGPKVEPCGTPNRIGHSVESYPLIETYCLRFERHRAKLVLNIFISYKAYDL